MSAEDADTRLVDLEVKLAYQEQALDDLHLALLDKEKRVTSLEERVDRLERALKILAERQRAGSGPEVEGKMDVDDPVPRSG
jgi:uncharacterized coiled-coil protein SlyX